MQLFDVIAFFLRAPVWRLFGDDHNAELGRIMIVHEIRFGDGDVLFTFP